ncbi:Arginine metabolism regulation protein II [Wickerhamiella sorbophila]|uniref:Arginine metabolism regulation protein II n=1 Tax=Wickerhamiella sorbophila TaxID=45607 RepID=A0A2T0FK19_9ASCO|nr:Arginine metabolism regulation protein II [Wickerhamiella sorbophila]PRT55343.1 Arginine metabolism regulation protein II [Wickerhamiella sorbophila]
MAVRTKSYTGCWTCRSRKIKCDNKQPVCQQCIKGKRQCEGYSIKLRWVGSNSDPNPGDTLRRQVDFVKYPASMLYETYNELDDLLVKLHNGAVAPGETAVAGPFAVFQGVTDAQELPRKRSKLVALPTPPVRSPNDTPVFMNPRYASPANQGHLITNQSSIGPSPQSFHGTSLSPYGDVVYADGFGGFEQDLGAIIAPTFPGIDKKYEDVLFQPSPLEMLPPLPPDEKFDLTAAPRLLVLSRFLLEHYRDHVTPYMMVVIHDRNPWRTIYLPRAYAAIGDITCTGETTFARYTGLHAMTAIAAFHLRLKFDPASMPYQYYTELGERLETQAQHWLSKCLKGSNIGKYKDLLVALLSMATLHMVKGSTGSGEVPLGAAQRLINVRYRTRPKMSRKAKILHRICVMLTLLQKATVMTHQSELGAIHQEHDLEDAWIDKTFDDVVVPQDPKQIQKLEKLQSRQGPLNYMNDPLQLEEYFSQYDNMGMVDDIFHIGDVARAQQPSDLPAASSNRLPSDYEAVSTQLIHGLTPPLVYIFKQVVSVSRKALHQREANGGDTGTFSSELILQCTEVEAQLATYKSQIEATSSEALSPKINEMLNHHCHACHKALIVYHYRMSKDVNRTLLQRTLLQVIQHLEAINEFNKRQPRALVIPFLFPGFICACEVESDNEDLRYRYYSWLLEMKRTGLSSYATVNSVIEEVHKRRKAGMSSNWWDIVREWDLNLILT